VITSASRASLQLGRPMSQTFVNWSGSVHVTPSELLRPRSEAELRQAVAHARQLRVRGAGHSFTPLCATSGTLLDLSAMPEELSVDAAALRVWAPAGLSLAKLTAALWARGLSLPNQGDVNPQALAGALATGTHGTGAQLGSLSTFARAFRLVLADGTLIECSPELHPELFEAARLSLGLIGVVLAVQLEVIPAYHLEERVVPMRWGELKERFAELATQHRHAEFWLFPYSDRALVKTLHPTTDERAFRPPSRIDEPLFKLVCDLSARFPHAMPRLQRLLTGLVTASRRFGPAYRIFPSERNVRFEEMEYELPRAAGLVALEEAVRWVRARELPLIFPFELRWVAGDDIWLSPFHAGASASVSVHQYTKLPWQEPFRSVEPIFRAHAGRPHWAKRHSLTARDVFELYPNAQRFCQVRAQFDPTCKLANGHLRQLFDLQPLSEHAAHAG